MVRVKAVDSSVLKFKSRIGKLSRLLMKKYKRQDFILEIFLVSDYKMKKNVLAFLPDKNFPRPDLKNPLLGEIHLNPNFIKRQNESLDFMLIHGFLHLLGYDHIKKSDRIKMEKEEARLIMSL